MKYAAIVGLRTSNGREEVEMKLSCKQCGYGATGNQLHKFCPACGHKYELNLPSLISRKVVVDAMNEKFIKSNGVSVK